MNPFANHQDDHPAERESALSLARAALRTERAQVQVDREEAERLLTAARTVHAQALHFRDRTKRLARRFVRRLEYDHEKDCRRLEEKSANLATGRAQLVSHIARFDNVRSEFHARAAAARDRLHEVWETFQAERKRVTNDWAESDRHATEEHALLVGNARDLALREKKLADDRARVEAETAGLREEAAALDARIENARASLAELERRREQSRAELLGTELPAELSTDSDDLTEQQRELERNRAAVAALKESLEREAADASDHRRIASEQLVMLAEARAKWQHAERETVDELERLARELGLREHALDVREQRLIRADRRRRDDAYDLWQFRLHLEAWQTKLTAFEMRWHTEREQLEADYEQRVQRLTRRESELALTFELWEQARMRERERLRAELELWAGDRLRLSYAVAELERRRHDLLEELSRHAARALAAEERAARLTPHATARETRRLTVLRRWWEQRFLRHVREIDHRGAEATVERAVLDDRYRALHQQILEAVEREAAASRRPIAGLDLNGAALHQLSPRALPAARAPEVSELAALRNEVERLATLLLEMELPEPPDPPTAVSTPTAESQETTGDLLPFDSGSWAA